MLDFAWGFAARAAVMIPTILLVSALCWWVAQKFGYAMRDVPFDVRNMRTWPLRFAMGEAAVFGAVFAATSAALGDNAMANGLSGGAAALVTLGLVPLLFPKFRK
jgi:4-hydroxybenzoate polyprenyltransferase